MSESAPSGAWRTLSRRELLGLGVSSVVAGSMGLALGLHRGDRDRPYVPAGPEPFRPSIFLAIDEDGWTTVWVTRSEMGQGVRTALPMIVAEELAADWSRVRVEQAPASRAFGEQATVASSSIASLWEPLREAGAIARAMLITAAAQAFGAGPSSCRAERGFVAHVPSGRRLGYGALAPLAASVPVPRSAPRIAPNHYRIVGRSTRRLDAPEKTDGSAIYGLDVRVPGMLYAAVRRAPALGATLERLDAGPARAIAGVRDVASIESGVAVIAESTWLAFRGRDALRLEWSRGSNPSLSSRSIADLLRAHAAEGGARARSEGQVELALRRAARTIRATYEVPYLAHACMEPINCTARVADGRCEVWAPTQHPQAAQERAASIAGVPIDDCVVHVTLLGGGFGRRAETIEVAEAVELAKRTSPRAVQVVWSREDDLRHDRYRHAALHRFEVGLDDRGRAIAWRDRIVSPSMEGKTATLGQVDALAVDGARDLPYAIDAIEVLWRDVDLPVPLGIWRSVGHSFNAFAVESMIDELAAATEADPLHARLALLRDEPRLARVLERVASMARWDDGPPAGRARGVAAHACFGSAAAEIAEVSVEHGRPRVHRVWAAVDCGRVVNPSTVRAQIEGGVVFGLSAALHGEITIEEGCIVQSNFHDYPIVRIDEMPEIEVEIVESTRAPSGVGELGVPAIAPAVTNAIFAATGERVRRLPIALDGAR